VRKSAISKESAGNYPKYWGMFCFGKFLEKKDGDEGGGAFISVAGVVLMFL
jgi:hypothetical protein